jgi:hypothetical protein
MIGYTGLHLLINLKSKFQNLKSSDPHKTNDFFPEILTWQDIIEEGILNFI